MTFLFLAVFLVNISGLVNLAPEQARCGAGHLNLDKACAKLSAMRKWGFLFALWFLPIAASAGNIAISEVLFDPEGTDTGLEYVSIRNFGSDDVDISGWDLYPDGVGYFTFPDFTLYAGDLVKIHLRLEGTDDGQNLYHPNTSKNMGNFSGSVALFSGTTHSADTIISYVRYHKPGSSEKKTWVSAASDADIWRADDYVDISEEAEEKVLALSDFSQRTSSGGWEIIDVSSSSSLPLPFPESSGEESAVQFSQAEFESGGISGGIWIPAQETKIKVYAGEDRVVLAGAMVDFEGVAEGTGGEPISNARFLWNFGDGVTMDGQRVVHTFLYPGTYTVFLDVAYGSYNVSDALKVRAVESPLIVSEIKPDSFVEIKNDSARTIDISRFGIKVGNSKPFSFPLNTLIAPRALVALSSNTLGFPISNVGEVKLLYPNGSTLSSSIYPYMVLSENESLVLDKDEWKKARATPGEKNQVLKVVQKPVVQKKSGLALKPVSAQPHDPSITSEPKVVRNESPKPENLTASVSDPNTLNSKPLIPYSYTWLLIGLAAGIAGGLIFVVAKYFLARKI